MEEIYDVICLGGGPAAITAGIYAKRAGLKVMIIEKSVPGGQIATTYEVCNYPGFIKISGVDLATKFFEHANAYDIPIVFEEIKDVTLEGEIKEIVTFEGTYKCKTIIICLGAMVRKLNLGNERQYIGKGLSYCATCDGTLYKDKTVAVVGGGNTAIEDAIYMAGLAKKVYLVHRREGFRADKMLLDDLRSRSNVEFVLNSVVASIDGAEHIEHVVLDNLQDKTQRTLDIDGLFVAIGRGPDTEVVHGVELDERGYIIADEKMRTNIPGVYAAGDIRNTPLRQIVTACSDGAIAATAAYEYISRNSK